MSGKVGMPANPSPTELKVAGSLRDLAAGIDDALRQVAGERYGFALFVFPLNQPPPTNGSYVANCSREDVAGIVQGTLDRWKAGLATPDVRKLPGLS